MPFSLPLMEEIMFSNYVHINVFFEVHDVWCTMLATNIEKPYSCIPVRTQGLAVNCHSKAMSTYYAILSYTLHYTVAQYRHGSGGPCTKCNQHDTQEFS